ncbi:hypothetical protein [Acidovorax sp. LjRoot117]|uniref:hypothetical protein n=1 Tax=Acidovorax sp. LjRoot117 TaxID=3342255 RepID=UPI003F502857
MGTSHEILERLRQDPVVPQVQVQALRLELPYDFSVDNYAQILSDTARYIAPELGWSPAAAEPGAPCGHCPARAADTSRPSSITAIA